MTPGFKPFTVLNLHRQPHNPQIFKNFQPAPSSLDANQICGPGNDDKNYRIQTY